MFDPWGIRKQRRKEELQNAILEGQVRALLLVLASTIDLVPTQDRQVLIKVLKIQVGNGFTSELPGLDSEAKQVYNDFLSMTLQNFIKVTV